MFDISKAGNVNPDIYNVKGQLVKSVMHENKDAGSYSIKWNGNDNYNRPVSSGVYFYMLTSGGKTLTKKMMLMK